MTLNMSCIEPEIIEPYRILREKTTCHSTQETSRKLDQQLLFAIT